MRWYRGTKLKYLIPFKQKKIKIKIIFLVNQEFFFFKQVSEQPQPPCTKFEVQHKIRKLNENNKYITYIFMRRFESFI